MPEPGTQQTENARVASCPQISNEFRSVDAESLETPSGSNRRRLSLSRYVGKEMNTATSNQRFAREDDSSVHHCGTTNSKTGQ